MLAVQRECPVKGGLSFLHACTHTLMELFASCLEKWQLGLALQSFHIQVTGTTAQEAPRCLSDRTVGRNPLHT